MIVIYTDGSCVGNGKEDAYGGFSVVVCEGQPGQNQNDYKLIAAVAQRSEGTTNNREELKAIIYALEHYGAAADSFFSPIVYSDSKYCVNTFTDWIDRWKRDGWVRQQGKPIENLDLVQEYDRLSKEKKIDLRWIKGHNDNPWNQLADDLATGRKKVEEVLNGSN